MKILIIQLRRLGDILLTTPVISYLAQVFPDAQIDFLTDPAGRMILGTNPHLNENLLYNSKTPAQEIKKIRSRQYDVIFDFLGNPRTALLTALSGAPERIGYPYRIRKWAYNHVYHAGGARDYVGLEKIRLVQSWLKSKGKVLPDPDRIRPSLYVSDEEKQFAQDWMAKEGLKVGEFLVFAPVSRVETRQWRAEGFRDLALKFYREHGLKAYMAWGPGEEDYIQSIRKGNEGEIFSLPDTSMRQMAAIIKNSRFVVTNNSGIMHTAIAMDTPTVSIQGPTKPIDWNPSFAEKPLKAEDIIVQAKGVDCLGCHLNTCPIGHLCMTKLSADEVATACEPVLKRRSL